MCKRARVLASRIVSSLLIVYYRAVAVTPLCLRPRLGPGTAVIVEGMRSKPEWNDRRGLVQSFDAGRGRYALLVKGRAQPLSVPPGCCRLESVVEQERLLQVAARRARIEVDVRDALAARNAAAPEPTPQPEHVRSPM